MRCLQGVISRPSEAYGPIPLEAGATGIGPTLSRLCIQYTSKMTKEEPLAYNTNLRAPIYTEVNPKPKARVHSREWQKIMNAEPVEINPSIGYGYKVCLVFVQEAATAVAGNAHWASCRQLCA